MIQAAQLTSPLPPIGWLLVGILVLTQLSVFGQNRSVVIKGTVEEKIIRQDGKEIFKPLDGVWIQQNQVQDIKTLSNIDGAFSLEIPWKEFKKNPQILAFKENYDLLIDKARSGTRSLIDLEGKIEENRSLTIRIYMSKKPESFSKSNSSYNSIGLSGWVTHQGEALPKVEVKIKGMEQIHDFSNDEGNFEVFLPENKFNQGQPFTIVLEKDQSSQNIIFANLSAFRMNSQLEFADYEPPKKEEANEDEEAAEADIDRLESNNSIRENLEESMDASFKKFIGNLDNINFKELSTDEIQDLKDSLKVYAEYLSQLREEVSMGMAVPQDSIIAIENTLNQTIKQLAEKEKELFQAELANKNKLIIILSLIIVLIILSSLSYYYFYINKKINTQAHELNKRNQFIEFLLRELNHRVTNNLQVISSMLRRKIRRIDDEKSKKALKEINGRVVDIATIHVGLYSKNDERLTKLSDYLLNIAHILEKLYGHEQKIQIKVNAPTREIMHKDAVFFGLIINELVTNSLKYAFEGIEDPELLIEVEELKEKLFFLKVQDNGKGIPQSFNLEEAKSSGLKLVNLITQMLGGSFQMSNEQGTKFEMTLKVQ